MYINVQCIEKKSICNGISIFHIKFTYALITLYLQVKEAIQSNSGDLSAAEAECARIGAESEEAGEERPQEKQQGSAGGKGKGKSRHPEDDFLATMHQQLLETGQQVRERLASMCGNDDRSEPG